MVPRAVTTTGKPCPGQSAAASDLIWSRAGTREAPAAGRPAAGPPLNALVSLLVTALVTLLAVALLLAGCGEALVAQAYEAEKAGDLHTAVELYQRQLERKADDRAAIKGLAVDLFLLRDFDSALPFQEKAVALYPADVQLKVELAFNYLNHQDRPDRAVAVLAEAVAHEPSAKILTFLAQAQMAAGKPADAEASLRAAITKEPQWERAYVLLIRLLEQQGRLEDAAGVRQAADAAGVRLENEDGTSR